MTKLAVEAQPGEKCDKKAKGKQPVKKQVDKANESNSSEVQVLEILMTLQGTLERQSSKLNEFNERLNNMEQTQQYEEYCDEYEMDCEDQSYMMVTEGDGPSGSENVTTKRSNSGDPDRNNNNTTSESRFQTMSKRFKAHEECSVNVDGVLAQNINELFVEGIDDGRYTELTKDEINARPENCHGLVVVKLNQMIWDAISPMARTRDKKMQNIETSVIKSAVILTKVVNKLAGIEKERNDKFGTIIDECNDSLALLGHANRQINLTRKDFLRPELNAEYSHLCNHSRPVTSYLFGDDVSKSARELEDSAKITNKMFTSGRPYRGGFMRRRAGRVPRYGFRGGRGRASRGRGQFYFDTQTSAESKNFTPRGSSRGVARQ